MNILVLSIVANERAISYSIENIPEIFPMSVLSKPKIDQKG